MTPDQKKWIDEASFEEMIERWKEGQANDPLFKGDTGGYFLDVIQMKRKKRHKEKEK